MSEKKGRQKTGRKPVYSKALGERICKRIADGESIRGICEDPKMPSRSTVMSWYLSGDERYKEFSSQYARACEIRAEIMQEECIDIADQAIRKGESGEAHADIQAAKLKIDTRKWFMSKLSPKRHSVKPQVEINNSNTGDVVKVQRTEEEDAEFIAKFQAAMKDDDED